MQFIRSSFWAGVLIGFKAFGNILVNKIISSYYQDPQLFALLAHFQNLIGIFSSIPVDGVNQGTIKYLADKDTAEEESRKIFNAGVWLNGLIFLISAFLIMLFKDYLVHVFAQGMHPAFWIGLVLIVLLIMLFNLYFLSLLLSRQNLKLYAVLNISSIAAGVLLVYFCIANYSFSVVLLAVGIAPSSLFFMNAFIIHKYHHPLFNVKLPDIDSIKKLGQFILMAASIMLFGRMVDFVVREYAMSEFTIYQTGLWQSVVKFSDYYTAAFISLVGMVYYPKISQLIGDQSELKKYVRVVMKASIPVIALGLLVVFFLREYILVLFFDEQFKPAEKYFEFQLIGDFLRMASFFLGFIITAQARVTLFIGSQAASAVLYILLIFLCTEEWGMEGFPIAHAIRYFLYFIFTVLLYRKLVFS